MKRWFIFVVFCAILFTGNAQKKYYSLNSYKHGVGIERTNSALNADYSRRVLRLRKYELDVHGGFVLSSQLGFRAFIQNGFLPTPDRKHHLGSRLGYVVGRPITPDTGLEEYINSAFISLGYEFFPDKKIGINVGAYQYVSSFTPEAFSGNREGYIGIRLMY